MLDILKIPSKLGRDYLWKKARVSNTRGAHESVGLKYVGAGIP
jgi:hypothetical protein